MYCISSLMRTIGSSLQWGQSQFLLFMWAHLVTWHTHTHSALDMIDMDTHTLKPLEFNTAFLSLFSITVDDSGFMCVYPIPLRECLSLFSSSFLRLQEIKACFRLSKMGRGLWDMLRVLNFWSGCYIKLFQDHTHAHAYERHREEQCSTHTHKWYDIICSLAYLHCSSLDRKSSWHTHNNNIIQIHFQTAL